MTRLSIVGTLAFYTLAGCGWEPTSVDPQRPHTETARFAATYAVPGDFPTLRDALMNTAAGDTIELAEGVYDRGADVRRQVTIRGAGMGRTVIRGSIFIDGDDSQEGPTITDLTLEGSGRSSGMDAPGGGFVAERVEVTGFRWGISVGESPFPVTIRSCRVAGNVWGIDLFDMTGRVENTEVLNNSKGGLVARSGVRLEAFHNTVVGNGFSGDPDEGAGGITAGPFGRDDVRNNIVVGNRYGLNCLQCRGGWNHNAVWGNSQDYVGDASPGAGDVGLDPQFVDPAGGDFDLQEGSPCIDAGTDVGVVTDAGGRERPFGAGPDLGAHEFARAVPGLVVNEVMANPLDERTGEFVEIHNAGDAEVDVAGLVLSDGDATDTIEGFSGGPTVIPAGGFGVVLDRGYVAGYDLPAEAVLLTVDDAALGNALSLGDPVRLTMPDGALVSTYDHPQNPGNGVSAERVAPDAADVPASWVPSPCGASPGAANCVGADPGPDPEPGDVLLLITEVMANPLVERTGEFIEVLNAGGAEVDLAGAIVSDGDSDDPLEAFGDGGTVLAAGAYAVILDRGYADEYTIPEETLLLMTDDASIGNGLANDDPVTLRAEDGTLLAAYSHPFDAGNGTSVELVDVALGDAPGNWVASTCEGAVHASPGAESCAGGGGGVNPADLPMVINEVMANPLLEDSGEFVELLNVGQVEVDVAGMVLDDGDARDVLLPLSDGGTVVAPGGYALVLDPEYEQQYSLPEGVVLLRPTDTSLGPRSSR